MTSFVESVFISLLIVHNNCCSPYLINEEKFSLMEVCNLMWVITVYSNESTTMYEFKTEMEAREVLANIDGCKILSEVIYFNDINAASANA